MTPLSSCICGQKDFQEVFHYQSPPRGETLFEFSRQGVYTRFVYRCRICGHYMSFHQMDTKALYAGAYMKSTYGNTDALQKHFERIISLPSEKSDNTGRVNRVNEFANSMGLTTPEKRTVLDVGSGLCVFLDGMKRQGWKGTALDPDPNAIAHATQNIGLSGICGDFMTHEGIGLYSVITFNKVIEHVDDPVSMLKKALSHLKPNGFVYIELPNGQTASQIGPGREEFFIEHLHIFSPASVAILAHRAGFSLIRLESLIEPSGKYTLFGFLKKNENKD